MILKIVNRIFVELNSLIYQVSIGEIKFSSIFFAFFKNIIFILLTFLLTVFFIGLGKKIFRLIKLDLEKDEEIFFYLGTGILFWGNLILFLGILGLLKTPIIWMLFLVVLIICQPEIIEEINKILVHCFNNDFWVFRKKKACPFSVYDKTLLFFLCSLIFLNLLGSLTPEKGIDALYYHLYYPKVYLESGTMILPARGSRLFSLFPHLASMIYLLPVSLGLTNVAQIFHYFLGLCSIVILFLLLKKIFRLKDYLIPLLFYSPILVGSISRSAYSDFFITFYLGLFLLAFLKIFKKKRLLEKKDSFKRKIIFVCGLMLGGCLSIKIQSLALIPLLFLFLFFYQRKYINIFWKIVLISLIVVIPWYGRSLVITGNPIFPIFSSRDPRVPKLAIDLTNFNFFLKETLMIQPALILIFLIGTAGLISKRGDKKLKYSVLNFLTIYFYWLILPSSFHDNRTFLPFLFLSVLNFGEYIKRIKKNHVFRFATLIFLLVLFLPRFYTNILYLPVVLGLVDKQVYLSSALKSRTDSFYDFDKSFSRLINKGKVLVDNAIGLYYADFAFTEYEYSLFYDIDPNNLDEKTFKEKWKNSEYKFLLLKNESLEDFFAKRSKIKTPKGLFKMVASHEESKTYLFKENFYD